MLEIVRACPICGNNTFKSFLTCKDYTTSGETFHVEQCTNCAMTLTNPRPVQSNAGKYYQSSSYISHTSSAAGIVDYIYLIIRRFTLRWKRHIIKRALNNGPLLDMGCGTGSFLNYCAHSGINSYGVEPSDEARAATQNPNVFPALVNLPAMKFQVITLWHVLEHIYNLEETIGELKIRLAENGTIFIAVPNWESFDASHYKEKWAAYDVPRHVWHFSKKDMTSLIKNAGLQVKGIRPMKLDAFYVSLLSEKYSNNGRLSIISLFSAVITGLRSNIKAIGKKNYSSLIYIIQR